ncbi:hypothetical protein PV327_008750 [Microctonus hyperodae]|uniref:Uncharacterized protein n=1 Tax=Microctonus hyperodae TaxID=165561 RepID=A0AA39FSP1_MICHY|nr:hypothetical protein PV327_008750 [Microctonus hyperodae]
MSNQPKCEQQSEVCKCDKLPKSINHFQLELGDDCVDDYDNNYSSDYDSDKRYDEDDNYNSEQDEVKLDNGCLLIDDQFMNQPQIKKKSSLKTELAQWVNVCGVMHDATSKLLKILKNCNVQEIDNLPLDSRTLLNTPELPVKIREVAPDHHFSIHKSLLNCYDAYDKARDFEIDFQNGQYTNKNQFNSNRYHLKPKNGNDKRNEDGIYLKFSFPMASTHLHNSDMILHNESEHCSASQQSCQSTLEGDIDQ